MSAISLFELTTGPTWQDNFMILLPMIRNHARIRLCSLPPSEREDAVQEAIAAACANYQTLAARGHLHIAYPSTLADFAVRHVKEGRHVGSRQDTPKDVLSPKAQCQHGLRIFCYDEQEPEQSVDWREMAIARRRQSIPDTAAFRIDFARWLRTLSRRDRKIIHCLIAGDRPSALADRFGVTRARISQLRRRYEHEWHSFQGEPPSAEAA